MKKTSKRVPKVPDVPTNVAWDILWRSYIKALKANKLDNAERIKKQIDAFDQRWLKEKK